MKSKRLLRLLLALSVPVLVLADEPSIPDTVAPDTIAPAPALPPAAGDPPTVCDQIPDDLQALRPECTGETQQPPTPQACVDLVAAGQEPTAGCQKLMACYDGFPTVQCLNEFPSMLVFVDRCAVVGGTPLVCLHTEAQNGFALTLAYAPGHPQPVSQSGSVTRRDRDRRGVGIAKRILGIRGRQEEVVDAAQDLRELRQNERGGVPVPPLLINRSFSGAALVFLRLLEHEGLDDVTYPLYFISGTRVEDRNGELAFKVEVPHHGGTCEIRPEDRYSAADARTASGTKRRPDHRRRFRELRESIARKQIAPAMGLRNCTSFVTRH